ncbi:hypothetical protein Misp01_37090 [Microtetraspora sp. NBRC 13810]|uniref:ester cyclase n=1 Tax=Microtetraspora sp. NBRC 13810 TaxID=3030990 RepID=UPI0024A28E2F|nr:nuclear transport factor 2 family protein [Microtetraspora sp. NBRC 13810]GLW08579.1 hypothetical protein Misp01_37090 [Microtetraspora sp. NBRC 13810]
MTEDPKAVGHRMYEAFNARDLAALETILSPGFVSHPLGTTGVEAVTGAWAKLFAAFPGIRVTVQDMLADGDRAAVRTTLHGTAAATGEPPTMLEIFRVREGRIAELWGVSTLGR